jgi:acetyl esterase/lipase
MNKHRAGAVLAATVTLGLAATACSSSSASTSASASTPASASTSASAASLAKLTACPSGAPAGGVPAGGVPAGGVPAGGVPKGAAASIPVAKTIKPSDTRNSIVIDPTGPQVQCGQTQLSTYLNVVYSTPITNGKTTELKLDIQVPKTAGSKPLVVYITGGGFQQADQSGNLNQRTYVAEQGYVVASIQYRTTTVGATYKDAVTDVRSAIRYLRAHAAEYHINASKVAVWGQSAGGYLAAMTGTTNGLSQFNTGANLNQSSNVQAVVDEFGPSDLSELAADYDTATQQANYAAGNSLAQWVFGPGTKKSILNGPANEVAAADPISYITSSTPPFVELQGTHDQLVSPSQTELVNNALLAKGVESTRYLIKGAGHGDLTFLGPSRSNVKASLPWSTQKVMDLIVSFLNQHLGS